MRGEGTISFKPKRQSSVRQLAELLQAAVEPFAGEIAIFGGHDEFEIEIRAWRAAERQVADDARHGGREEVDDAQQAAEQLGALEQSRRGDRRQRPGGAVVVQALETIVVGKRDEGAAGMGDADEGACGR